MKFSQDYAQYLASRNMKGHSNGPYGENLHYQRGGSKDKSVIMAKAIKQWYDEYKSYDYNNPVFSSETGHFTQVVWKKSIEIGVGIATVGQYTVVCVNYRPAGNVQGQFKQNVLRPKSN